MSKSILIRVTNDEGYDDVAPEIMMGDVIGNPAGGWTFELVDETEAPRTEALRNEILEEIAGQTTMRSFANGEFNWCITDYQIRALKTPVSPQREKP